jgi:hypothetical protein
LGDFPSRVLTSEDDEREGYVANVIYTCDALRHGGGIDFALRNKLTIIASVKLDELLGAFNPWLSQS